MGILSSSLLSYILNLFGHIDSLESMTDMVFRRLETENIKGLHTDCFIFTEPSLPFKVLDSWFSKFCVNSDKMVGAMHEDAQKFQFTTWPLPLGVASRYKYMHLHPFFL